MNTEDDEWFVQKPKPHLKTSNLTLFMKENQKNKDQGSRVTQNEGNDY